MNITPQRIALKGIELSVIIAGEGPDVLLLHGFPDSKAVWRKQIPALIEAGFRVIVPDTRGCGDSDIPGRESDYELSLLIEDVRLLLDALKIDKVRLVAHDWGAVIAWQFALAHPERVDRYVALSVGHPKAYTGASITQKFKAWYIVMFQFRFLAEWFIKAGNWFFFRAFTAYPEEAPHWIETLSRPGRLTAGINYYRANFSKMVFPAQWPNVQVPVMGVYSTGDRYLTERQMTASAALVDAPFRYECIKGANHWMQLNAPDAVNALLLDYLK
jgi:pimeloyl-ACP methyl ester carboxylesterase